MQISSFKTKALHFHSNLLLAQFPGDNYAFHTPHRFHNGCGAESDEWALFALWLLPGTEPVHVFASFVIASETLILCAVHLCKGEVRIY